MARPAADRRNGWLTLLAPFPGRLEFSLRLAAICALTCLIVSLYQTPDPALTIYVVFFLVKPDRVSSIVLSLLMASVLTVTLAMLLATTALVLDHPIVRVAVMALFSFGLMFLASASKLRPVAPIIALISVYTLALLGDVPSGEFATRALLDAWLFVGTPASVSIVVNLLAGPAPRRLAIAALTGRLRLAAAVLTDQAADQRAALRNKVREGIGEVLGCLKLVKLEGTSAPADAALRQTAFSTLRIMLLAELRERLPNGGPREAAVLPVARKIAALAESIGAGGDGVAAAAPVPAGEIPPEQTIWWSAMAATLADFTAPNRAAPSPAKREHKDGGGFLVADAFSNAEHVRYALKTTLAAMLCYAVYTLLNWSTIHTCLITCYIVSLGSVAETVEKLSLRVAGCVLGAAAGIAALVFVVPMVTSIGTLMILIFVAMLGSAWVARGDARISYAGYQIAFAFLLCVVQGGGPAFDMVTVRDRIIGILFGNIVTFLVFTNIMPRSITARIDPAVVALLRRWGNILRLRDAAPEVSTALSAQKAIEHDLDLVGLEPRSMRPEAEWSARRRDALAALDDLAAIFWLMAETAPELARPMAARLDRIADRAEGADVAAPAVPAALAGQASASPDAWLQEFSHSRLDAIERCLIPDSAEQSGWRHAAA